MSLTVPAGSLPSGTSVTYWLLSSEAERAAPLPAGNDYLLSLVISWINTDGTVPDAAAGKPLVMTITNSSIKSGASVYSVVGGSATLLGVATRDGEVSVDFTSDPQIYVVQPRATAPTNVVTNTSPNERYQSVKITNRNFETGPTSGGNTLKIAGTFAVSGYCKITGIVIEDQLLPLSDWSITPIELSIVMPANNVGLAQIQIQNNCLPLLSSIDYFYADADVVTPIPVEIPTAKPPLVITKFPSPALKKTATFYFASGASALTKVQKAELTNLAKSINASKAKTVYIYGYADSTPGANNALLSKKRATSARMLLAKLVKGKIIRIGWYGSSKPLGTSNSVRDNAKNRRVEIWTK